MATQTANQVYRVGAMPRVLYGMEKEENPGLAAAETAGKAERWQDFVQERFAKFFNPRLKRLEEPAPGSEMVQKMHEVCDGMPEPKILEMRTAGDEVLSGMAAASICRSIATKVAETQKAPRRGMKKMEQRVRGLEAMKERGADVDKRLEKAKGQLAKAIEENQKIAEGVDPVAIREAVRQAVNEAHQEINDYEDGVQAFSYGNEPGAPVRHSPEAARGMAKRLKSSPMLQRIAKLAGRLRADAAKKQKQKTDTQCSEITNVELGRDLSRLLPSELASFADEALEQDFCRRYSEGRLLQYKLSGNESKSQGPIVFVLDESYSMRGALDERAKAVSMAMLEIAQRQKRGWALIHFSREVGRVDYCEPGKVKPEDLMDAMEHFEGGGTNFAAALDGAVELIEKTGGLEKADVIMVTDGVCNTDETWDSKFAAHKKRLGFNVYSVLVQKTSWGTVSKWSDEVFDFEDLLKEKVKGKIFAV